MRLRGGGCGVSRPVAPEPSPVPPPSVLPPLSKEELRAAVTDSARDAAAARTQDGEVESGSEWKKLGGTSLEPFLLMDTALGGSPVALVDARFLIGLAKRAGRLCRRQVQTVSMSVWSQRSCSFIHPRMPTGPTSRGFRKLRGTPPHVKWPWGASQLEPPSALRLLPMAPARVCACMQGHTYAYIHTYTHIPR